MLKWFSFIPCHMIEATSPGLIICFPFNSHGIIYWQFLWNDLKCFQFSTSVIVLHHNLWICIIIWFVFGQSLLCFFLYTEIFTSNFWHPKSYCSFTNSIIPKILLHLYYSPIYSIHYKDFHKRLFTFAKKWYKMLLNEISTEKSK